MEGTISFSKELPQSFGMFDFRLLREYFEWMIKRLKGTRAKHLTGLETFINF